MAIKLKSDEIDETKVLWESALESYTNKDYETAIEQFTEIISQKPNSINVYYNRALSFYYLGELELARQDLLFIYNKGDAKLSIYNLLHNIAIEQEDKEGAKFWANQITEFQQKSKEHGEIIEGKETKLNEDGLITQIGFFKSTLTFKDVIGVDKVKSRLTKYIIQALKHPELYKEYGKRLGDGMIFYGCSGSGKSYLAKAVAGEAKANVIIIRIPQIMSAFVGNSEKNVATIFSFARKHTPCILFFDEMDGVAGKRHSSISDSKGEGSALRMIINSLLTEMDGVEANPEGIFIIGATNKPWDIDSAFKRSGRFSDSIYIRPPNLKERREILKYYLKKKKIGRINYTKIALLMAGYSQADIARICDISLLEPITDAINKNNKRPLSTHDIVNTIKNEMPESGLMQWFFDTRKEILGHEEVEIVDDKKHKSFKSGILEGGERILYKPLIDDTINYTSGFGLFLIKLQRRIATLLP